MDPPDGITTNICCLGNVADIAWISYTWEADEGSADGKFEPNALYLIDLTIRRAGGYSYLDFQASCLWIFDLPKEWSSKDSGYLGFESVIELSKSHGLQETGRGTLLSEDSSSSGGSFDSINVYGKRSRSDETAEFMKLNTMAVAKHQSLDLSSDHSITAVQDSRNHDLVRNCLLLAVQSTCIAALVRSQHYISLGPGLFCSSDYIQHDPNRVMSYGNLDHRAPSTRLWSLTAFWQTNGAVLTSYNQVMHKDVVSRPEESDSDVVLGPMGWIARILSSSSHSNEEKEWTDHQLRFSSLWRSRCIHLIRQHGLQIEDNEVWKIVELSVTQGDDTSRVVEWPHRFCFAISNCPYHLRRQNSLEPKNEKSWIDPLQEAAKWVNDAKNRDELVKEQLSAMLAKKSSHSLRNLAEEEVLAHLQSRNEEGLDAQTIAGIYPTPPDVNKSHGHIHAETNPPLPSQPEELRPAGSKEDGNTRNVTPAFDASIGIANYDPLKDDDLFSDMDGGMDGDNGVTEDDFRFFDEPDESELLTSEPGLVDDMAQETAVEVPKDIDGQNLEPTEIVHDIHTDTPNVEDATEIETIASHTPGLNSESPAPSDTLSASVISAKEPASNTVSQTLDAKYSAAGKYGWKNAQKPLTTTPFTRLEQDKEIPLIRDNLTSTPSSASTPSSDPFQQARHPHEIQNISADEMDLFLKQARMLNQFITTCNTFEITNKLRKYSRDQQSTSIPVSPNILEHQSHGSIQLAQIVADQSVFYDYLLQEPDGNSKPLAFFHTADFISDILQQRFPQNQALTLQQCAELEVNSNSMNSKSISFSMLSPSIVRVKRADSTLELSNAALGFWKELSMKPLHGAKDITAICLCEEMEAYKAGSMLFLQSMEDTYRSLNLGSHSTGHWSLKSYPEGVVTVPGLGAPAAEIKATDSFCNQLGKSLSTLATNKTTVVVYIVKPDNGSVILTSLCILFQKIFEAYASMFRKTDRPSDLVLQIIPSNMIESGMQRILSNLQHHVTISKIVYNRCPTNEPASSAYVSASMVQLAQPLPISIDFRLSSDNSVYPSRTTETFHLAYSYSEGSQWLSASMIDLFGSKQWNASYYLGDYTDPKFVLNAVIHEIWEIVRLATDYRKTYNLFIAKTTEWSTMETEIWKNLAHGAKIPLFMLTYDTSCPIALKEANAKLQMEALESELGVVPPTPDVSSPDLTGTKGEDQEFPHRLVDTRNQAWWIATKQVMAMEGNSFVFREHLASGYLVHKNAPIIGISVVASTHAVDMLAIMEAFHGLCALARARCVHNYLPWHLAVAEGAQLGLKRYMSKDAQFDTGNQAPCGSTN